MVLLTVLVTILSMQSLILILRLSSVYVRQLLLLKSNHFTLLYKFPNTQQYDC